MQLTVKELYLSRDVLCREGPRLPRDLRDLSRPQSLSRDRRGRDLQIFRMFERFSGLSKRIFFNLKKINYCERVK